MRAINTLGDDAVNNAVTELRGNRYTAASRSRQLWLIAQFALALAIVAAFTLAGFTSASAQSSVRPPENAVKAYDGTKLKDGGERGRQIRDPNFWRDVRKGVVGGVSIQDKKGAILVQSEGWNWMQTRNGSLSKYGSWALVGMLALLILFYLYRGAIKIDAGRSNRTVTRFAQMERIGHWLLAVSFIILALTGLNVTYGKHLILPLIGKEAFASVTLTGKWLHNYMAFAFMLGLVWTLIAWVKHNFPSKYDLIWLAKGGGIFSKGSHPPAKKFNAGQKILFWLVIVGGASISLSGLSMMFPFELPMFAKTFAFLNNFGLNLPTTLTPIEEMQYASNWHAIMAIFLICVIFGHIYIGSIGMEGAFDAMGSGEVDANWAKEHHSVWYEEEVEKSRNASAPQSSGSAPAPAE